LRQGEGFYLFTGIETVKVNAAFAVTGHGTTIGA
jgi:hypothetical protein